MFRLVSLVGIVALTVAAAALAGAAKRAEEKLSQENNDQEDAVARITPAAEQRLPSFHARFSLN